MREALVEAIKNLPEREQYVMSMYYEHDMNLKEIAAVLGVTESRVCQLHSQSIARLRGEAARVGRRPARVLIRRPARPPGVAPPRSVAGGRAGQSEFEAGAAAGFGPGLDPAPMALDDALHDAQTDAAAGIVVAGVQPRERLEQLRGTRRIEADAVVLHAQAHAVVALDAQADAGARRGAFASELRGIAHQVEQHDLQRGRIGGDVHVQLDVPAQWRAPWQFRQFAHDLLGQCAQVHRLKRHRLQSRAGQCQQCIDRLAHALGCMHLQMQQFLVLGLQALRAAFGQQLRQALHMANRCAQFVGQLPREGVQIQVHLLQVARAFVHCALQRLVVAQQQRLRLLASCDVAAHAVVAEEAAAGIVAWHAAERDPQPAPAAAVDLELQRAEWPACVQVGAVLGPLLRCQRLAVRIPAGAAFDALVHLGADALLLLGIQRQQPVLGVGLPVPVGGQPRHRRPALLAGPKLLVRLAALGHVAAYAFVADHRALGVLPRPPADGDPARRPAGRADLELHVAEGFEPRHAVVQRGPAPLGRAEQRDLVISPAQQCAGVQTSCQCLRCG